MLRLFASSNDITAKNPLFHTNDFLPLERLQQGDKNKYNNRFNAKKNGYVTN